MTEFHTRDHSANHDRWCPHPDRVKAALNIWSCTYCEVIRKVRIEERANRGEDICG